MSSVPSVVSTFVASVVPQIQSLRRLHHRSVSAQNSVAKLDALSAFMDGSSINYELAKGEIKKQIEELLGKQDPDSMVKLEVLHKALHDLINGQFKQVNLGGKQDPDSMVKLEVLHKDQDDLQKEMEKQHREVHVKFQQDGINKTNGTTKGTCHVGYGRIICGHFEISKEGEEGQETPVKKVLFRIAETSGVFGTIRNDDEHCDHKMSVLKVLKPGEVVSLGMRDDVKKSMRKVDIENVDLRTFYREHQKGFDIMFTLVEEGTTFGWSVSTDLTAALGRKIPLSVFKGGSATVEPTVEKLTDDEVGDQLKEALDAYLKAQAEALEAAAETKGKAEEAKHQD